MSGYREVSVTEAWDIIQRGGAITGADGEYRWYKGSDGRIVAYKWVLDTEIPAYFQDKGGMRRHDQWFVYREPSREVEPREADMLETDGEVMRALVEGDRVRLDLVSGDHAEYELRDGQLYGARLRGEWLAWHLLPSVIGTAVAKAQVVPRGPKPVTDMGHVELMDELFETCIGAREGRRETYADIAVLCAAVERLRNGGSV